MSPIIIKTSTSFEITVQDLEMLKGTDFLVNLFKNRLILNNSYALANKLKSWCEENCSGYYYFDMSRARIYFEKNSDFMACELTFNNIEILPEPQLNKGHLQYLTSFYDNQIQPYYSEYHNTYTSSGLKK